MLLLHEMYVIRPLLSALQALGDPREGMPACPPAPASTLANSGTRALVTFLVSQAGMRVRG